MQKPNNMRKKLLKKQIIGIREFKFFYIIGWIIKYCITHWTNPSVLSRINPGLPNGGKCTLPKSYTYKYFTKDNPIAKKYFVKCLSIPGSKSWKQARDILKELGNKRIVLKPDKGIRSIGIMITSSDYERKQLLESRGKIDYVAQEHIPHKHELGVFYYKYPTWNKGKIMGIAERAFEGIADPHIKEQYKNRADLITPKVREIFNKIVWDTEVCFCRFDVRAENLEDFKNGEGFKILEANAGPDAVALHALDKNYPWKKQLKLYSEEYVHAFKIAKLNRHRPRTNLLKYFWFMIKDEIPLRLLKWRTRKIISYKPSS
jgi:hypothetical protein